VRAASPIIFLRKFNNFIKAMLVNEYTFREEKLSVLDLCCGKGGDIVQKWKRARIAHYVGADLSKTAVEEA